VQTIETYRGFVYPSAIDHIGHMNVQFYVMRFDEASWHFLARLGLGPTFLKGQNRGVVALDQRAQYTREVLVGSLLHIETQLIEIKTKTIRYLHRMIDSEWNECVATMELLVAYIDTTTRKSTPLPEGIIERKNVFMDASVGMA
jgi:acyl-CoA thioester hydrolase